MPYGQIADLNLTLCLFVMLSVFDRVIVRVRFNVQIERSNSVICNNSLSASFLVCELSSPRLD